MQSDNYQWTGSDDIFVCRAKFGRIFLPLKSSDFIVQLEDALFWSGRENRPTYMQLHAEIRWPVNLKQMYDQQIICLSSNQRRTHMVSFLCCFAVNK